LKYATANNQWTSR